MDELIKLDERTKKNNHLPAVIWLTGLSGSGKSTLAYQLEKYLFEHDYQCAVIDGDQLRKGLCADLGFSKEDRIENIRRASNVAQLFYCSGHIVIVALIAPIRSARHQARSHFINGNSAHFFEVFCDAPLSVCRKRDVKGLYASSTRGELKGLTGVDDVYEQPERPELCLKTAELTIKKCTNQLIELLRANGII